MPDTNTKYNPIDGEITTFALTKGISKQGTVFANATVTIQGYGAITVPCPVTDGSLETAMKLNARVFNIEQFAKLEMKKVFDKLYRFDDATKQFIETANANEAVRRRVLLHPAGKACVVDNIIEVMKHCIGVGRINRKDGTTIDSFRLKEACTIDIVERPLTYKVDENTPAFEI